MPSLPPPYREQTRGLHLKSSRRDFRPIPWPLRIYYSMMARFSSCGRPLPPPHVLVEAGPYQDPNLFSMYIYKFPLSPVPSTDILAEATPPR